MDGRKQVTVPETVTLGEKECKAPFPLKGKGPNDDDDDTLKLFRKCSFCSIFDPLSVDHKQKRSRT